MSDASAPVRLKPRRAPTGKTTLNEIIAQREMLVRIDEKLIAANQRWNELQDEFRAISDKFDSLEDKLAAVVTQMGHWKFGALLLGTLGVALGWFLNWVGFERLALLFT